MIKTQKLLIFHCLLFLFIPTLAFAQISQENAIRQQDRFIRDQQQQIEKRNRQKEFDVIKKERERRKKEQLEELKDSPKKIEDPHCTKLKKIELSGWKSISTVKQQKLFQGLIGRCIDGNIFAQAMDNLNKYHHKLGYVTTQISVPQQNIKLGIIRLNVIEGRVEKIMIERALEEGDIKNRESFLNNLTETMQKMTAFGTIEGNRLNIKDIDQGVYQMNRLSSSKSVMKIEPGSSVGESIVMVNKKALRKRKYSLNAGYNNLGNDFTGIRIANLAASADNALFLNENISLNYSTNLEDDSSQKETKSFSSFISIPFGYYTFGFEYSKSDFLGVQNVPGNESKVTGFSDRNDFSIDRLAFTNDKIRINLKSSLTSKKSANYSNYVKSAISERKIVIANVSSSISYYPNDFLNIYLKPSYSKGLKGFNALKDDGNRDKDFARAQFEVYKIYASLTKRLKLTIPLSWTSELNGQISKNSLFGSEQISIGGNYSVRGYRENFLTGDSGYYSRNKLHVNLVSLLPKQLLMNVGKVGTHLQKITIEPFFDYGYASNRANNNSGRLSGYGVKTIFSSKLLDASLTYSKSANRSQLLSDLPKEKRLIYFELTAHIF